MKPRRPILAEQADAEFEEQIVLGNLAAGQRLLPDMLANLLRACQTPVKEARNRLVGVVKEARRGTRQLTRSGRDKTYAARRRLEWQAVETRIISGLGNRDAAVPRAALHFHFDASFEECLSPPPEEMPKRQ